MPALTTTNYFKRAYKLRAATIAPSLLGFARLNNLFLYADELEGGDLYNGGEGRTNFIELADLIED